MSRRFRYTLILVLVGLGACLAAFTGWRYARVSAPVNGPVVLISVDALRPDHLSAYGYTARKTPAIDRLAADGVVFERAYAHAPQTLPSHASLLTGKLPFETGVRDTVGFRLADDEWTLAEALRDRGYATAGVVSSFALRKESGVNQGFTLFDAAPPPSPIVPDSPTRPADSSETIAERWLDSAGTDRAFLFLHVAEPGAVLDADAAPDAVVSSYDDRVAAADAAVGQLVEHLEAKALYDRSTIIVLSDHGQGLGAHGELNHGLDLDAETLRVPLIIKTAEGRSKGVRVQALVQMVDVMPTVLDLVKAPIPGGMRGRSLASLFSAGATMADRPVYAESLFGRYHFGWSDTFGLIDTRYQYVSGAVPELYDLSAEPGARRNLAQSNDDVVKAMERQLADLRGADRPEPAAMVDADARWQYERLGYVGTAGPVTPAVSADPTDKAAIVERYRTAIRHLAAGDGGAAIRAFTTLTALLPDSIDAWLQLATTAAQAGRSDVAFAAYSKVAEIDPALGSAQVGSIEALLALKKFDLARTRAEQLLVNAEGVNAASAHELLARIALARHRLEAARSEAEKAEAVDATRPVAAYINGRISFEQRRFAEALTAFEAAARTLEEHQERPLADLALYTAETLIQLDRLSEAEYVLLRELKRAPLAPRARTALGAVYLATGRTDEAAALARP